jgi:hypothetical protein
MYTFNLGIKLGNIFPCIEKMFSIQKWVLAVTIVLQIGGARTHWLV